MIAGGCLREFGENRAGLVVAKEMAVYASIAARDFNSARLCSEMEYWNMCTRMARVSGEAVMTSSRMGICNAPKNPQWSKKAIGKVIVSLP